MGNCGKPSKNDVAPASKNNSKKNSVFANKNRSKTPVGKPGIQQNKHRQSTVKNSKNIKKK